MTRSAKELMAMGMKCSSVSDPLYHPEDIRVVWASYFSIFPLVAF